MKNTLIFLLALFINASTFADSKTPPSPEEVRQAWENRRSNAYRGKENVIKDIVYKKVED